MVYIENFEFRVSLACMTYVLLINSEAEPTSSALLSRKSLSLIEISTPDRYDN
jgi:hypothetical protein